MICGALYRSTAAALAIAFFHVSIAAANQPDLQQLDAAIAKAEEELARIKEARAALVAREAPGTVEAISLATALESLDPRKESDYRFDPTKEAPIARFASAKEGDYAALGIRLNRTRAASDTTERPRVLSIELSGQAEIDKNRGAEVARFASGDLSWGSDLALIADIRYSWHDQLGEIWAVAARQVCAAQKSLRDCRGEEQLRAWLASANSETRKQVAKAMSGAEYGRDQSNRELPAEYFLGIRGSYGWQKESFFEAGTLPATADDKAPRSERYNPFSIKGYGGLSIKTDPTVWNLTAVGSLGWQRRYAFPKNTENQSVCLPSASRNFTTCKPFNLSAPFEADGLTSGVGLNFLTREFELFGRLRAAAFWQRDFALDQSTYTGEFAFAFGKDGTVSSGLRYQHLTDGIDPFGNNLDSGGALTIFFETNFLYPKIP
jgi:hypothetical protein